LEHGKIELIISLEYEAVQHLLSEGKTTIKEVVLDALTEGLEKAQTMSDQPLVKIQTYEISLKWALKNDQQPSDFTNRFSILMDG